MATEKKNSKDNRGGKFVFVQNLVEFGLVQISLKSVRVSRTETEHSHRNAEKQEVVIHLFKEYISTCIYKKENRTQIVTFCLQF